MIKRIYTREEINTLSSNQHVVRCSEKSITYSTAFKELAVRQYNEKGLTSREIFERAGFDVKIIGSDSPNECVRRWRRVVDKKGVSGLVESRGRSGGRPKTRVMTDKERIQYLEAKVAYMDAENDFLAKLRGLKRE